jgi:hypothetical protein
MEIRSKILITIYVIAAVLALVLTWYHVPAYLGKGIVEANRMFWDDALFNTSPSGKFIVIDILFLAFVCNMHMFIEGRRLGIKYIYFYVVSGVLVAISVAFPLFLAAREIYIAKNGRQHYQIKYFDLFALILLFLAAMGSGLVLL